jgi:ABC-type spermidine/putrescine transport system permease subunit II
MPLSLKWYTAIFTDQGYVSALKNSLVIASLTVVFSVLVGTLAAAGLTQRSFKGEQLVHTLVFLPFLVPGIVLAVGLLLSLEPLRLGRGYHIVVIAHSLWATPLVFLIMAAVLQGLDPALADAAKSLGANPLRAFLEVTLPLTRAGMLSSVILAFVISFHEFIMALFLATPSTRTLPVVVWTSLRYEVRPIIASIDSLMIVSVIIALILIARLVGIEKIKLA